MKLIIYRLLLMFSRLWCRAINTTYVAGIRGARWMASSLCKPSYKFQSYLRQWCAANDYEYDELSKPEKTPESRELEAVYARQRRRSAQASVESRIAEFNRAKAVVPNSKGLVSTDGFASW